MSDMESVLLAFLEVFPDEVMKREQLVQTYSEEFAHLDVLETHSFIEHSSSVYAKYTILSGQLDDIPQ